MVCLPGWQVRYSSNISTIFTPHTSPGLIWSEIKQLWDVGLKEYVSDLWNVVDFITNSLYVATIGLRLRAYYDVSSLCCCYYNPQQSNIVGFGQNILPA